MRLLLHYYCSSRYSLKIHSNPSAVDILSSAPPVPPRSGRPRIWAQNFYRYSVACLAIAPFVAFHIRRGGPRLDLRAFALCLVPSLPNVVHQITQTVSLFYIGPGVYAIFTRSSVIMTALLALIFFPEERHILRQWQFQVEIGRAHV